MPKMFFIYKTTNKINGKYYIGAHETSEFHDGYLGSGKLLKDAIDLYGKENFSREILEVCNSRTHMYERESVIVNQDVVKDEKSYNLTPGGYIPPLKKKGTKCKNPNSVIFDRMNNRNPSSLAAGNTHWVRGKIVVKDRDGNMFHTTKDDPRFISGELVHSNSGKITVKDRDGNMFHTTKDDPRFISGELVHISKNVVLTCPHCSKTGGHTMRRWHFDHCSKKKEYS